jgi:hypothetical protein
MHMSTINRHCLFSEVVVPVYIPDNSVCSLPTLGGVSVLAIWQVCSGISHFLFLFVFVVDDD